MPEIRIVYIDKKKVSEKYSYDGQFDLCTIRGQTRLTDKGICITVPKKWALKVKEALK